MKSSAPTALVILDGFGYSTIREYNAIAQAHMPNFQHLLTVYPWRLLAASGDAVGLLPGMAGNSEVGHLTIGAGRIVKQLVVKINEAITDGTFAANSILQESLHKLASTKKALHIMGLLSDAHVHGNMYHMFACIDAAVHAGVGTIYVHVFLDGRDTLPQSATEYLQQYEHRYSACPQVILGSMQGRFYAMDRNNNWRRTEQAYRVLTQAQETPFAGWREALAHYYAEGITDEFIPPIQFDTAALVRSGDGVIITNFRADRARQLVAALTDTAFTHFARSAFSLQFCITLADYKEQQSGAVPLFEHENVRDTLKDILSNNGMTVFSIAETEKYAHITYFFDGGREATFNNETRVLIPSIMAHTYAKYPRMSADSITHAVIDSLKHDPRDFYLVNYANADMVGHSGNFDATVKAIECLDQQLGLLYSEIVLKQKGTLYIIGDHGKAEVMHDKKSGQPCTGHTTNPVYFVACSGWYQQHELPKMYGLADVVGVIVAHMV